MERDGASKNDYVHARFQSSELGRFLSPDVLGGKPEDPQTWNRYAYARNNPLGLIDPDGLAPAPAWAFGLAFQDPRVAQGAQYISSAAAIASTEAQRVFGATAAVAGVGAAAVLGGPAGLRIAGEFLMRHPSLTLGGLSVGNALVDGPVPTLRGGTVRELFGEALGHVGSLRGTGAQKADLFQALATQIAERTGGAFQAARLAGPQGASVFVGRLGEVLVITSEGQLFRGKLGEGVQVLKKLVKIDYEQLRAIQR
jgi:RHS repeat-associated protein